MGKETSESFAEYDAAGNLVRSINALDQKQDYDYDSRGRLLSVTQYAEDDKEIKTRYEYDKSGRLLSVKKGITNDGDKSYQKLTYEYSGLGDLLSETDESGNRTYFEYDQEGQVIKQTDRNGVITNYSYDGLGRLIGKNNSKDGDENSLSYEYNLLGNIIRTRDESGTTDYSYDEMARIIQERIIEKNQDETAGSGVVVKKYGYDSLSRVTSFEIYNNSTLEQKIGYQYNELGQLTALREDGDNYEYEYDKVGRLTKEINPVTCVDTNYTYYASGDIKAIITDKEENSAFGSASTASAIEWTEYGYDKLGNVTSKLENNVNYTYNYDMLNRLSTASHDSMMETYSYDKYGNISRLETALSQPTGSSINLLTTTTDYSYDANNRLTKMQYNEGEADYSINTNTYLTYDQEGNLIEKSKWNDSKMYGGSQGETDYYNYNGFNQLAEFEKDTGLDQNEKYYYYYNADGLRAKKVKEDNGTDKTFATKYYYNGGKLVLETDGEGVTTAKTLQGIHLIKREVMNVQGIGLTQTQGGMWGSSSSALLATSNTTSDGSASRAVDENGNLTYFYVQNSRGDVIKLLNENGDIIRDYEYEPFGKEEDIKTNGYGADYLAAKWKQEVEDNAIDNPFRFGGEYKDEESGNYYLRARYYDPEIQRFTQEDTYKGSYNNPMSLNGYAFCGNNPINKIDPSGLKTVQVGSDGKAPKGLNVGDVVKTAGGNYTITTVNKDGSYKSIPDAKTIFKKWSDKYTTQLSNASEIVSEIEKQQRQNNDNYAFLKELIDQGYSSYNGSYIFGESYIKAHRDNLEADFMLSHADLALSYIETMLVTGHIPTTAEVTTYVASSDNAYANLISGFATGILGGRAFNDGTTVEGTSNLVNVADDVLVNGAKHLDDNPLANIKYTDKVVEQMKQGDFHGFPDIVDNYGSNGIVESLKGGDDIVRTRISIPGNYKGKSGVFEYIIEPDGVTCNHRFFKVDY